MLLLQGVRRTAEYLAFSPDGVLLAASDRGGPVEVWDATDGRLLHTFPSFTRGDAYGLQFHPTTGELYAPGNADGVIVHDPRTGTTRKDKFRDAVVARVAVAPDGKSLVYYHYRTDCREFRRRTIAANGTSRASWAVPLYPPNRGDGWTRALAFVGDGTRFATTDYAGKGGSRVAVRAARDGEVLATAKIPLPEPWGLAVSADANWFVVRGGGVLLAWHATEFAREPRVLTDKKAGGYNAMAFHPSNRLVAAAGTRVRVLDAGAWTVATSFAWSVGRLGTVCVSADGTKAAAAGENGRVVVWDLDG